MCAITLGFPPPPPAPPSSPRPAQTCGDRTQVLRLARQALLLTNTTIYLLALAPHILLLIQYKIYSFYPQCPISLNLFQYQLESSKSQVSSDSDMDGAQGMIHPQTNALPVVGPWNQNKTSSSRIQQWDQDIPPLKGRNK